MSNELDLTPKADPQSQQEPNNIPVQGNAEEGFEPMQQPSPSEDSLGSFEGEIIGRHARRQAMEQQLAEEKVRKARAKRPPTPVSSFVEFAELLIGALVSAILILTLVCRTGVVDGSSMVPTMQHGDRYLISDLFYTPEQGDIVVFRPQIEGEESLWIKRIIALEGQTVYINPDNYRVYVDGKLLDEPYLIGGGTIPHSTENPITVPEGCVYVLGDNRALSHDSRYKDLGCVKIDQLAGRVLLRFWPLDVFGFCE